MADSQDASCHHPEINTTTGFAQCPYKGLDGCKNGVGGRGLSRQSISQHLNGVHRLAGDGFDRCRDRIKDDLGVFSAWESLLRQYKLWLCTSCMHFQAWRKDCKNQCAVAPFNGRDVNYLIHGIPKLAAGDENSSSSTTSTEVPSPVPCLDVGLLDRVFRSQTRTVRHIPAKCRLNFSRVLKLALDEVTRCPMDTAAWVKLLLLPSCTLGNYTPKDNAESKSGARKNLQTSAITHALSKWREVDGCFQLAQDLLLDTPPPKKPRLKKKSQLEVNQSLCKRKACQGAYTAAMRILTSNGTAPNTAETLADLQLKHPVAPPPTIPSSPIGAAPFLASKDLVLGRIKSFPRGTSCGRDGLHAQHLLDALSGSAAAIADEVLTSITAVVNLLLAGRCPPQLSEYIASAPLTPLLKPDGSIRPIAVGTIWRRLVSKVAALSVCKDMSAYLSDFQFGVGVPCGGEAILHSVNRILAEKGHCNSKSMLLVDFRNAFNLVDRTAMISEVRRKCPSISKWVEFCYSAPARLYYGSHTLSSSQGVQQGDPLGPLLFALTLHPIVLKISQDCDLDLQAWYLDDGTLVGDTLMVSKALQIIQEEGKLVGLALNIRKTELFWPSVDERSSVASVFPTDIARPALGVKLLGGPVSLDPLFCKQLVKARVDKTVQLIDAIQSLEDPQIEMQLLRNCSGVSKLYFTLRTTAPIFVEEAQKTFDCRLFDFVRQIVTSDGPGFGDLQMRVASLPLKHGGLGLYTMEDTMQYCYLASCLQTQQIQGDILRDAGVSGMSPSCTLALDAFARFCGLDSSSLCIETAAPHPMSKLAAMYFDQVTKDMPTKFCMTHRDLALWKNSKTKHTQDYLMAIPIGGLGQRIGSRQFSAVLCYRLGVPLFANDSLCPCCGHDMDIFGDHAIHCAHDIGLKFRHDFMRDTIADICYRIGVHVKIEASLGFLNDDGGEARPADILVPNWENGRDTCFDVTGVSPFTGNGVQNFSPGVAISRAVDRKRNKYLDICYRHGYCFGTLAFTTLGEIGEEFMIFLNRLKNFFARHDTSSNLGNFLFHRVGVAIQRGVGAQLVARLPTISIASEFSS